MQLADAVKAIMLDPRSIQGRAMVAAILESLGVEEAVDVWVASIRAAIATGQFFPALTLARRYLDGQLQLFAMRELALRFGEERETEGVFRLLPTIAEEPIELPASKKKLIAKALEVGTDITAAGMVDSSIIPEVPIFGKLEEDEFIELAQHIEEILLKPDQILIEQGSNERSVYILAHGYVRITQQHKDRDIELAIVGGPAIIGEISLLTAMPRSATVQACDAGLAWKISPQLLSSLSQSNPYLFDHLLSIVKERLLENVLKTSKLFADPRERRMIFSKFIARSIKVGQVIFAENSPPPGLFIVLHGTVELYRFNYNQEKEVIAELSEGDVFGELSLLSAQTTAVTAWMEHGGVLLHLEPEIYQEMKNLVPNMNHELNELVDIRRGELHSSVTPFSVTPYQGQKAIENESWLLEELVIEEPTWVESKDDLPQN